MTHPDLETLLAAARAAGLRVGILSNGIGISEHRAGAIIEHADFIRISQDDAPDAEQPVRHTFKMYDHLQDEVSRSLENLARARKARPQSTCAVGFSYTIQKNNLRSIPRMVEYVSHSATVRELEMIVTFKIAHGAGEYLCTEEDLRWLRDEVLTNTAFMDHPCVNLRFFRDYFFPRLDLVDIARGEPTRSYYRRGRISCFTPSLFSFIDAFGGVYVCCHLYDDNGDFDSERRRNYVIGDITERSFLEVWGSPEYQQLRARLMPINVDAMPACGECTRHWVPNTLVSRLFEEVFQPLVEELGAPRAIAAYEALASAFPQHAVWF